MIYCKVANGEALEFREFNPIMDHINSLNKGFTWVPVTDVAVSAGASYAVIVSPTSVTREIPVPKIFTNLELATQELQNIKIIMGFIKFLAGKFNMTPMQVINAIKAEI